MAPGNHTFNLPFHLDFEFMDRRLKAFAGAFTKFSSIVPSTRAFAPKGHMSTQSTKGLDFIGCPPQFSKHWMILTGAVLLLQTPQTPPMMISLPRLLRTHRR